MSSRASRHLGRTIRFGIVGASGIVINTVTLAVATGWLGWHYLAGAVIATQASTAWNYLLTDLWVFRDRRSESALGRYGKFWLVNNTALVLRGPMLVLFVDGIGIHYLTSNVMTLVIVFVMRYVISWKWIWRKQTAPLLHSPELAVRPQIGWSERATRVR